MSAGFGSIRSSYFSTVPEDGSDHEMLTLVVVVDSFVISPTLNGTETNYKSVPQRHVTNIKML